MFGQSGGKSTSVRTFVAISNTHDITHSVCRIFVVVDSKLANCVNINSDLDICPQCHSPFNGANRRPVQESCGHVKCRLCFISNEDGCPLCDSSMPIEQSKS